MELKAMITKRKSVRKYTDVPAEPEKLEALRAFMDTAKPLYPDIRVHWQVVDREQVRVFCPVKTPQLVAVYSENKDGYLENVGFLFQQMELYLQSVGFGVCWLGLGKPRERLTQTPEGMEFVILLGFGYPEGEQYRKLDQFQRKPMEEISDTDDARLEPARLAPSSTNSQPWYFTHGEDTIHAYCSRKGLIRHVGLGAMNRIDMGIALAHLYTANPDTFRFFRVPAPAVKDCDYIGSFTLDKP